MVWVQSGELPDATDAAPPNPQTQNLAESARMLTIDVKREDSGVVSGPDHSCAVRNVHMRGHHAL